MTNINQFWPIIREQDKGLTAVSFCMLFLFLLVSFPSISSSQNGKLMSKVAYQFPFDSYQAWLGFMDKAPDSAWHSSKMRALIPESTFNAYKQQKTITIERIQYLSDELLINGFLIKPKHVKTPLPVVLYAHGGVGKWGRITFFDVLELSRLAERGYIVIASTLRGEMGSEGKPNLGKGDRQDMLSLLTLAKKLEGTDTDNIGLWGFSRGGGLGYRVIASTDQIKTAVLVGASSDLVNSPRRDEFHTHVYPGIVDNYEKNQDLALRELSAIYWPERLHPKTSILLLHGSEDNRVSVLGSQAMSRKLTLLSRPHKYVEIIGGSHTLIENLQQVRSEIDDWFDTHLKLNRVN